MRLIGIFLFALISHTAFAASPEDDYIGARDKAFATIAKLVSKHADDKAVEAANTKALADLQGRLTTLLGPFKVAGFPAAGKISLESLNKSDEGIDKLDGLAYTQGDNGPTIVATTRGLLERWLKTKANQKDANVRLPAITDQAVKRDDFYTSAFENDATFAGTADLPLKQPEGADLAFARLGGWGQDIGPNPDQAIVIVLVKGNSVMIADAPAQAKIPDIAACKDVWAAATAAADKFFKIYQDSKLKNEKAFNDKTAAEEKGDRDYRACMSAHLPSDPVFPALVKQAQDLVDNMAGK